MMDGQDLPLLAQQLKKKRQNDTNLGEWVDGGRWCWQKADGDFFFRKQRGGAEVAPSNH
jgi:hypothetical protein